MSFVVEEAEIITGERLQAIADVAVLTPGKRAVHPSIPHMREALFADVLTLNDNAVAAVRSASIVFVYSDFIDFFFDKLVPLLDHPVVLMTNGGDQEVGERYRPRPETGKLRHWFALNATIAHPKVTAIPIGLANSHWPHGDTAALAAIAARPARRRSGLYVNFNVHTNPAVRGPILSTLSANPFAVMGMKRPLAEAIAGRIRRVLGKAPRLRQPQPMPFANYLSQLAGWKFCASPPGNGVDCHRTWEALYLGVIPVLTKAPVGLLDRLPCIFVDDFASASRDLLEARASRLTGPFEYERLTVSYWRKRIVGQASGRS